MTGRIRTIAVAAMLTVLPAATAVAAELRGSPASMRKQHEVAVGEKYTFLPTGTKVMEYVDRGRLEPVEPNGVYAVKSISYPYARTETRQFIERVGRDFREATGGTMVVTSLTRPTAGQPSNAHKLSVHPTGMAVDLRIPADSAQRAWLESHLLDLERQGVLDVTREKAPPHYHVAIFPRPWSEYEAARVQQDSIAAVQAAAQAPVRNESAAADAGITGEVQQAGMPGRGGRAGAVAGVMALAMVAFLGGRRRHPLTRTGDVAGR
jgi:hypothetical protein